MSSGGYGEREVALLLITALLFADLAAPKHLEILLQHHSTAEQQTQKQLERLLQEYDLSPWFFTDKVVIDEDAIPHSHPVLTLHTRHLRDDVLLFSTFIHEQSHHYFVDHADKEQAVAELKVLFPKLPVGFPDGSNTADGNYEHLIVIALEYRGLAHFVGELRAHDAMLFWADDHYRVLYRLMLDRTAAAKISDVMKRHGFQSPVP